MAISRELARYLAPGGRAAFRDDLVLDTGSRLGDVLEGWQRDHVFAPLDERNADGTPRYKLLAFELARGSAKTTMAAAECLAELVVGGLSRRVFAFACDEDQSALLHEAAAGFVARSPLLSAILTVEKRLIRSAQTGSYLRVMSGDAPSAYGLLPDLIVVDEIAEFPTRALWDSIYTSTVKRRCARVIAISTPGWSRSSIAWSVREAARTEPDYYLFSPGEPLASWIDPEEREWQRRVLPAHVFERLHLGRWSSSEGAFITSAELDACIRTNRQRRVTCSVARAHVIAVDLGLQRDRTAIAVLHRTPTGVALDDLQVWSGTRSNPVSITDEVEPALHAMLDAYPNVAVLLDPWQSRSSCERLTAAGARVESFVFTPARIDELTRTLLSLVRTAAIELFPDQELEKELLDLQIIQKEYGVRLDHRAGRHDDRAIAIGMGAWQLMQLPAEYAQFQISGVVHHDELMRAVAPARTAALRRAARHRRAVLYGMLRDDMVDAPPDRR